MGLVAPCRLTFSALKDSQPQLSGLDDHRHLRLGQRAHFAYENRTRDITLVLQTYETKGHQSTRNSVASNLLHSSLPPAERPFLSGDLTAQQFFRRPTAGLRLPGQREQLPRQRALAQARRAGRLGPD